MRRFTVWTLLLCGLFALALTIGSICRHGWVVLFYLQTIIAPFVLLAIPKRNVTATRLQCGMLVFPAGAALGCLLICNSPTGCPDGEVMGWLILTALWGLFSLPFCCIPLFFNDNPPHPQMNTLHFRQATPLDLPALRSLYDEIIDAMDNNPASHAQWKRGGYPTDAFLQAKAAIGELWVAEKEKSMVAAMVLNAECNPGYSQAQWQVNCQPHEVMAIHTLGVSPRVQGQGVGKAMVQQALRIAREQKCKCMRLDVIDTNPAAGKFYSRLGFTFLGRFELDYPGAVCTNFDLYEKKVEETQIGNL